MSQSNFSVYQKPLKSEYDRTFDQQVKQKPQRVWPGKGVKQDSSDDDLLINKNKDTNNLKAMNEFDGSQLLEKNIEVQSIMNNQSSDDDKKERNRNKKDKYKKEKQQIKNEQIKIQDIEDQNDVDDEYDQEEEEQDEESCHNIIELLKPVFVSRVERERLDRKWEEEIRLKEEKEKNLDRKKLENRMLLIQTINSEHATKEGVDSDDQNAIPNDDDDPQQDAVEYGLWKIRELKRLKRDHDEQTQLERDRKEIERRRNLTDEQRLEEDFRLGSDKTRQKDEAKYVFMQKYYHKGAYFQDSNDPIFNRDYNLPVGEDLFVIKIQKFSYIQNINLEKDKSNLPSILQKRRGYFGKRGQSKYTHLTDQVLFSIYINTKISNYKQDTTDFDPFYQVDEGIRQKFFMRQAGNRSANKFDQFFKK